MHPDSGIFWYRKRVPAVLVDQLGKREYRVSLRTRDPAEAKVAFSRVAADVEARWKNLRVGVRSFSQKQAVAIAGEIYRDTVARHEENPGDQDWGVRLVTDYAFLKPEKVRMSGHETPVGKRMYEVIRTKRYKPIVDAFLEKRGLLVDDESRERITTAVSAAMMQAHEQLQRYANGDYRPDPDAERFPALSLETFTSAEADAPMPVSADLDRRSARARRLEPSSGAGAGSPLSGPSSSRSVPRAAQTRDNSTSLTNFSRPRSRSSRMTGRAPVTVHVWSSGWRDRHAERSSVWRR
ncbi:hypothetical protein ASG43_06075 [Aureimonas sp. Leaf454]|uniref:DUF6538 domain-containing protein n=1 Tax=Aureimonas sp. Leaf454 TaxID=1736381 RepID=UPI0006F83620|nr:hypothetical protein ASG43_06075 [Aureimonas sp. Leaf454]